MLTISLMKSADYYFDSVGGANYYLKGGEPPGEWFGKGAARLGLDGTVSERAFRRIFDGFKPYSDGGDAPDALVGNAGNPNRQSGWDLTFSAPKSVSVLWSQADEQTRPIITESLMDAVKETLAHLESTIAYSRTGKAGMGRRQKVDLTFALFRQSTSRAMDPNLHCHSCLMNVGLDEDGVSRTIVSKLFYKNKMLGGAFMRAALARNLEERLGVRCRRVGKVFEIEGVPQWSIDHFSKRRKQVLAEMARLGVSGAKAAAKVTLLSRPKKEEIPPRDEMHSGWRAELAEAYKEARREKPAKKFKLKNCIGRKPRRRSGGIKKLMKEAMSNLTRNRAHFVSEDLFREALYLAPEYGLGPDEILNATLHHVATDDSLVRLDSLVGERFTTLANLKAETRLLEITAELHAQPGVAVKQKTLDRVLKKHTTPDDEGRRLNEEQERAFLHLVQSTAGVRFLHGLAGTGKTSFTMRACIDAWQREGYEVIGTAPTTAARKVLAEDTGLECQTITRFLGDYEVGGPLDTLKHHGKQLVKAAAMEKTTKRHVPKPRKLTRKSIVLVDEAGMVNLRHFDMLMRHVRKSGATLVFLGDPYQLPPVEGTAPFKSLSRFCGYAELTDIQRQEQRWARDASIHFSQGEPGKALRLFADHDRLVVGEDKEDAITKMVKAWASRGVLSPDRTIIICSLNRDVDLANSLCQQERVETGVVNKNERIFIHHTRKEEVQEVTAYEGDRVVFTQASSQLGVENGTLGTITRVREQHVQVRLDDGDSVEVNVNKYKHLRLGYAVTTYKSQGDTVDYAYLLAGGEMQDLPTSYVQATRAKKDTTFFTTQGLLDPYLEDIEDSALADQMGRRPDLSLAASYIYKPRDSDFDRAHLCHRMVGHYLERLKASGQNECIVVPTRPHAELLNQRCHERLDVGQTDRVVSQNNKILVVGDKVVVGEHQTMPIAKGMRAKVVDIIDNKFIKLKFDHAVRLNKQDTFVLPARELDVEYAHALTVDQANTILRDCPNPFVLLDSPNELSEFLDVSLQQQPQQQRPRLWSDWLRDLVTDLDTPVDPEGFKRREAERKKARDDARWWQEYRRQEEERMEEVRRLRRQQSPQRFEELTSNFTPETVFTSNSGLSTAVYLPPQHNTTPTHNATPTQSDIVYEMASGAAAIDQRNKHIQEQNQAKERLVIQTQDLSQTHTTHIQRSWY